MNAFYLIGHEQKYNKSHRFVNVLSNKCSVFMHIYLCSPHKLLINMRNDCENSGFMSKSKVFILICEYLVDSEGPCVFCSTFCILSILFSALECLTLMAGSESRNVPGVVLIINI